MCQVIGLGIIGKMKKVFQLLTDADWEPCLEYLLNLRGKAKLTVTVQKYKKKRSTELNKFYWACVITPLSESLGYTPAEMHDELLGAYYGWEIRDFRGHQREYPRRRTTSPETADTMDFMGLIQTGQQIAASLGVHLPDQAESLMER